MAAILADVRARGDWALFEYTRRFDRHDPAGLAIGADEVDAAVAACAPETLAALDFAAKRIRAYHDSQKPQDLDWIDASGVRLGARWHPIEAVGLYVPGGTASYPSSVLMNAIPAKVAGVDRLVMVTPTPDGLINPLVLAAARLAGVDEIYRIGGAQAVAALAYGTATIHPVDKIVGPGNAYVASAKRQVFGMVGIDTIAGPSEILVVADGQNDPAWIAADLLSQAEHDPVAQSILITDDGAFARCRGGRSREPHWRNSSAAPRHRRGVLAPLRRDHPGWLARRGAGPGRPHRPRACRTRRRRSGRAGRAHPQCRGLVPRPPYARGRGRLCRRAEPCAADFARGPVRLRAGCQ